MLAPARLVADLGGRMVRPGGSMAGAWPHVVRVRQERAAWGVLPAVVLDLDPWVSRSLVCAGRLTGTRRMSAWGCSPSECSRGRQD